MIVNIVMGVVKMKTVLINELSAAQILLAEALIDLEYKGSRPTAKGIARAWLRSARIHTEQDWSTGAKAIRTYLRSADLKGADDAINMLFPLSEKFYSANRLKKSVASLVWPLPQIVCRSQEILTTEYGGSD
jgi:hypothetical protein